MAASLAVAAAAVIGVVLPDLSGTLEGKASRLSHALGERPAILVVAEASGFKAPPGWVLFIAPAAAKLLDGNAGAVVDSRRTVRAVAKDAAGLAPLATAWMQGREIYTAQCLRCHGADGTDEHYTGIKPLRAIGKRFPGPEILERTIRSGNVDMTPIPPEAREALLVFVASL